MNKTVLNEENSLMLVYVSNAEPSTYSLDEAARLVGLHAEMIRYYCRLGLCGEVRAQPNAELIFDDDAIYQLRRFEDYRRNSQVSRKTLRLVFSLWRELDILQAELRFLRSRTH